MDFIAKKFPGQSQILAVYFFWIFTLSLSYFAAIQANAYSIVPFLWAAIGLSGIIAIFAGVKYHHPSAWMGWVLLAVANIFFILGDTHYNIHEYIYHRPNDFPSLADAFYLATYPLFAAGMFVFIRRRIAGHAHKGALLDAAIFTLGLSMLVGTYLVIPNAAADVPIAAKLLSIAYPLSDILIGAMLVRLLLTGIKVTSIQFLAFGAIGLIISDILYGVNQFYGVWSNGSFIDLGWICFYAFWGAAAIHSSMKTLDNAVAEPPITSSSSLYLLAGTALIAPILLIIETLRGNAGSTVLVIAILAVPLFILVILRMASLVRTISQGEAEMAMEKKKSEAFSIVSHQLKTPVSVVTQLLGIMLGGYSGKLSSRQRKLIEESYAVNQRLLRIVEDLLNVGQIDAGKLRLHKSKTDIVQLARSAIRFQKPKFTEQKHKFKFECSERRVVAEVDPEKLKMVFENIIDNACKYSLPGKVIHVDVTQLKRNVKVAIKDQGVGIGKEDMDKLFQKFSRVENPLSQKVGGTGLGLYWAKKIVDEHGGSVKVMSKPDRGTTFIISLPR